MQSAGLCGSHALLEREIQTLAEGVQEGNRAVAAGMQTLQEGLTSLTISVEILRRVHERIDKVDLAIEENRQRWERGERDRALLAEALRAELRRELEIWTERLETRIGEKTSDLPGLRSQVDKWRGLALVGGVVGFVSMLVTLAKALGWLS